MRGRASDFVPQTDPYGASGTITKVCPFCRTEVIVGYTQGCNDCCSLFGIERFPGALVKRKQRLKRVIAVRKNAERVAAGERPHKIREYLNKTVDHWRFVVDGKKETTTE